MTTQQALIKTNQLKEYFQAHYQNSAVTFSGGVDSSLLLYLHFLAFGEQSVAITIDSITLTTWERERITRLVQKLGVQHFWLQLDETESEKFVLNDSERCYYCKKLRLEKLAAWAQENNITCLLDGSNIDDLGDYRPGMKALAEVKALATSPFTTLQMGKEEIRFLAKTNELESWNIPSSACLASRIEFGLAITHERLAQIEQAEEFLRKIFDGNVRLRHHDYLARIEMESSELEKIIDDHTRNKVYNYIKDLGFKFVTVDLLGYSMGSMNTMVVKN